VAITRDDVLNWIKSYAQAIEENCEMLTNLDREIGDADHGANMRRGFRAVLEKLPSVEDKDIGTILKNVGMTLLSKVGGAAGPLYSTMFTKAGMTIGAKMEMDLNDWAQALEAGTTGIAKLGKALPNDKTMLDALYPALNALSAAMGNGASVGEALQNQPMRLMKACWLPFHWWHAKGVQATWGNAVPVIKILERLLPIYSSKQPLKLGQTVKVWLNENYYRKRRTNYGKVRSSN